MKLLVFRLLAGFAIAAAILGPLVFGMSSCRSAKHSPPPAVASLSPELIKIDKPVDEPKKISSINKVLSIFKSNDNQPVAFPEKKIGTIYEKSIPRKCKGCTIVYSAGPATVTTTTVAKKATAATGAGATATTIEKAKAPVTTGTGDATDQSGTGVASTIKGNNNAPVLTNAPVEAPDWKAQLAAGFATPVGKVLAVLLLAGAGYSVYRLWPLLRRKSSDTQS